MCSCSFVVVVVLLLLVLVFALVVVVVVVVVVARSDPRGIEPLTRDPPSLNCLVLHDVDPSEFKLNDPDLSPTSKLFNLILDFGLLCGSSSFAAPSGLDLGSAGQPDPGWRIWQQIRLQFFDVF